MFGRVTGKLTCRRRSAVPPFLSRSQQPRHPVYSPHQERARVEARANLDLGQARYR